MKLENEYRPDYYRTGNGGDLFTLFEKGLLPEEETKGFYKANIIKYVVRHEKKNGIKDLKKAKTYLSELIKFEEAKQEDKDFIEKLEQSKTDEPDKPDKPEDKPKTYYAKKSGE